MKNQSLAKWRQRERSLGAWVSLTDLHIVENLIRMEFDWLCFDLQHGLLSYSDLLSLIPIVTASDKTPIVRVAKNDAADIGRMLDAGAHGVIVPLINTQQEAEMAVAGCRYPPAGNRSLGPMRGIMQHGIDYVVKANDEIACIAMIETAAGLDNVEAIAATPGIDALFVGPMDLCFGLGIHPGDFGNRKYIAALTKIKAACEVAGCAAGLFGYTPDLACQALGDGFVFASAGTDIGFFREGAAAALKRAGVDGQTTESGLNY
jgi:4-hydroxy-2-oxoheptanedioate aldolase